MKEKYLLVDGIYPPNTRSRRIFETINKESEIRYCLWDRSESSLKEKNQKSYIYLSREGYGNKIKKILGMRNFYLYLKEINRNYNPKVIIASQWDMLLLCYLLKNKNQKLIYDNIDMPSSNSKLILIILKKIEKICLKKVDGIIFASRFFQEKYLNFKNKTIILENKPLKKLINEKEHSHNSKKIKISFIGTLRYYSILEKLVNSVRNYEEKIEVLFFGSGPDEKKIKDLVAKNNQKNVIFFGEYNYEDISKLYHISDIIWAVYPEEDYNVKYAISNKFHESIIFEKICLFSKNTLLGKYVVKNNIGLGIDINEVDKLIQNISKNEIDYKNIKKSIKKYKENNFNLFWEDDEENLKKFIKELK